jgi:hypothetical protein
MKILKKKLVIVLVAFVLVILIGDAFTDLPFTKLGRYGASNEFSSEDVFLLPLNYFYQTNSYDVGAGGSNYWGRYDYSTGKLTFHYFDTSYSRFEYPANYLVKWNNTDWIIPDELIIEFCNCYNAGVRNSFLNNATFIDSSFFNNPPEVPSIYTKYISQQTLSGNLIGLDTDHHLIFLKMPDAKIEQRMTLYHDSLRGYPFSVISSFHDTVVAQCDEVFRVVHFSPNFVRKSGIDTLPKFRKIKIGDVFESRL